MGTETELKFRVPARRIAGLKTLNLSGARRIDSVERELTSTYFDTRTWKLKRGGLVLRVREADGRFRQTVKSLRPGTTARGEWEVDVESRAPDLSKAGTGETPLAGFKRKKLRRKLQPIFTTSVQRTAQTWRTPRGEIELAIDRGRIKGGDATTGIAEVEIELKKGQASELFRVARLLDSTAAAELDLASKSDKGFRLLGGGTSDDAVHAEDVVLDPEASPGEAFRAIALAALRHFSLNADGVRAEKSEAVHQMRVGLRRLRAAISLFAAVLPPERLARIKDELKWLTNELAAARELDVFMRERIDRVPAKATPSAGLRAVRKRIEARRDASFDRARRAVASPRYRALLIDVLEWIETLRPAAGNETVADFGPRALARRLKKARKQGRDLDALTPAERHKLRIKMKKIRYGIDFMKDLYPAADRKRLARTAAALKRVQSALGALNDFRVHRKLAADLAMTATHDRRAQAFSTGFLVGLEQEAAKGLLATAEKAMARLRPLP